MQERIFTIPCIGGEEQNEELNRFLRGNKVVSIEKQFFVFKDKGYWSFCVEYVQTPQSQVQVERKTKIDYKEVLDAETFEVFSRLRAIRKQFAEEEAVPAFSVFTDAELAEISKLDEISENTIKGIAGIGEKRVEKYARRMVEQFNRQTEQEK